MNCNGLQKWFKLAGLQSEVIQQVFPSSFASACYQCACLPSNGNCQIVMGHCNCGSIERPKSFCKEVEFGQEFQVHKVKEYLWFTNSSC